MAFSSLDASERLTVAEDDASHGAYNDGWNVGQNSGSGFGPWGFFEHDDGSGNSHVGRFIAHSNQQVDLQSIAYDNKAWGMFANGAGYEIIYAFRSFNQPLQVGNTFSILMETGDFVTKYDTTDPKPGEIGFALRTGNESNTSFDFSTGARMQFVRIQGELNYQLIDGEESSDTGIFMKDTGVSVNVTLTGADTYDVEIVDIDTGDKVSFEGRSLAGDAGSPIESIALYNLDGETNDAYFNALQVSQVMEEMPR